MLIRYFPMQSDYDIAWLSTRKADRRRMTHDGSNGAARLAGDGRSVGGRHGARRGSDKWRRGAHCGLTRVGRLGLDPAVQAQTRGERIWAGADVRQPRRPGRHETT